MSSLPLAGEDQMPLAARAGLAAAWPTQMVLVAVTAWLNTDRINPDALSYMRIAQYYLGGQTHLMISGYWGPMLSWLIAPWLLVFEDPLDAARAAMAVSAVVFLLGGHRVLRVVKLPPAALAIGTWILALLGVAWSVSDITPDLLMAGILCCGTSMLLSRRWAGSPGLAVGAGVVLGASYLTKAVSLPVSLAIVALFAATHVAAGQIAMRQAARAAAITVAGFLIVAGPWIGILSYKYGRIVFSTSAPVNHAFVGPPDVDRRHLVFRTFHNPAPGRINAWEDPTDLPYRPWSPLQSVEYAVHQARIIYYNADRIVLFLKGFDWLGLGLVSAVCGFLAGSPWRRSLRDEPWRWSLIPVVCLSVVYLPVYAEVSRFFIAALPFLMAASLGFALHVTGSMFTDQGIKRAVALTLVALSFVIGNQTFFLRAFQPSVTANRPYLTAKSLANRLRGTPLVGPIASVGPEYETGLYLSYLLRTPFFGRREEVSDLEQVLASGAGLVVVPRGTAIAKRLRGDSRFRSADNALFGCDGVVGELTSEVFLTKPGMADDRCPESRRGH